MMTEAKRLVALIRECAVSGVARRAMLLRADRLPPALARPHHLRLAEAALAPLLRASRAQAFRLPGPRVVVVWRGDAEDAELDAITALQMLLQDGPADSPPLADLIGLYDLPNAGEMLLAAINAPTRMHAEPLSPEAPPAKPLDIAALILLEATLAQADLARFARRRAVWQLQSATPAWEARAFSTRDLGVELTPGRDLHADPWLFHRLTRTLDRRMLALLTSPGELAQAGPFSFNLNVASILSPEFLRFDDALPAVHRGHIVLNLAAVDIFADPPAFAFARGFARTRSYRLLLRDVTPALARVLALDPLDVDYLDLRWSADLPHDVGGILAGGPERIVLNHADDAAALAWARSAGIGLVQGAAMESRASPLGERATAA